jgi:hypothetical protein
MTSAREDGAPLHATVVENKSKTLPGIPQGPRHHRAVIDSIQLLVLKRAKAELLKYVQLEL